MRIPLLNLEVTRPAVRVEVGDRRGDRQEQQGKGQTRTQVMWTDKQPHPTGMDSYEQRLQDPEASIAISILTGMIAGVGYYLDLPTDAKPGLKPDGSAPPVEHPNKKKMDDYGLNVNLDEKFVNITQMMLGKGICPVEILSDYTPKLLPAETFYIWKTKLNQVYRYTQEISQQEIARWDVKDVRATLKRSERLYRPEEFRKLLADKTEQAPGELSKVVPFVYREDPLNPYGHAQIETIGELLDARKQMNEDIPDVIHHLAYPMLVWEYVRNIAKIKEDIIKRKKYEDIFLSFARKDDLRWSAVEVTGNAKFIPYVELVYYQICEALNAPLLLYLKNATEASATKMLDAIDRMVQGIQRTLKRKAEALFFAPQCTGGPIPRINWGAPRTGLEDITLTDISTLYRDGTIKFNQAQELLKSMGVKLVTPEMEVSPPPAQTPTPPFLQPQQKGLNLDQILDKLKDENMGLQVVDANLKAHRISLVEATRLADRIISVCAEQRHPGDKEAAESERAEHFQTWVKRAMVLTAISSDKEFRVSVSG